MIPVHSRAVLLLPSGAKKNGHYFAVDLVVILPQFGKWIQPHLHVDVAVYFAQILKFFARIMVNFSVLGMRPHPHVVRLCSWIYWVLRRCQWNGHGSICWRGETGGHAFRIAPSGLALSHHSCFLPSGLDDLPQKFLFMPLNGAPQKCFQSGPALAKAGPGTRARSKPWALAGKEGKRVFAPQDIGSKN